MSSDTANGALWHDDCQVDELGICRRAPSASGAGIVVTVEVIP